MSNRVKRLQADRVNQKVYFAKLAIGQYQSLLNDPGSAAQGLQMAYENVCFHSHGIVLAYYQELSHYYTLQLSQPTFATIEAALALQQRVSPELATLAPLLNGGYIGDIIAEYQLCLYAAQPSEKPTPTDDSIGVAKSPIALHQPPAQWLQWLNALQSQIEYFRNEQIEY